MTRFEFQWNYKSSLGGPWLAGDVVELDDALAEAIQKDSPGVLKKTKKKIGRNRMKAEAEGQRDEEESQEESSEEDEEEAE